MNGFRRQRSLGMRGRAAARGARRPGPEKLLGARQPRGFTLMELIVSLMAALVLVAGMGSSIYLAASAANPQVGPFQARNSAATVLKELDRDLPYAKAVSKSEQSHRILEFQVPDRNGDGTPELIRYEWSGTPGDPLERILNSGSRQRLLDNVQHFGLDYHSRTVVDIFEEESPLQQWVNQSSSSFFEGTYQLSSNGGIGTDFLPALPASATAWSVTDVSVRCQRNGNTNGVIRAQITTADHWRRPANVVDEVILFETQLPSSLNWYSFSFPNARAMIPGERACLLFQFHSGSQNVMTLRTNNLSLLSSDTWLLTTSNGGASWDHHFERDLMVRINGTYTTPYEVETHFSILVSAELQVGDEPHSRMRTSVRTRNEPEVSSP